MYFYPNQSSPSVALKRLSLIRYVESWYRFCLLLCSWIVASEAEESTLPALFFHIILCHYFSFLPFSPFLYILLSCYFNILPPSNPLYWHRRKWIERQVNHFSSRSLVSIYRAERSISSREKKVELVMTSTSEDDSCLSNILVHQILAYIVIWPIANYHLISLASCIFRFFLLPCTACDDPSICSYVRVSRAHGESLYGDRPLPG